MNQLTSFIFKPNTDTSILQIPENIRMGDKEVISTTNFNKVMEKWKALGMENICQNLEKWEVTVSLFIEWNKESQILKHIEHVEFPFLKKIFLRGNLIESIESLVCTNMPLLEILWLGENNITSLGSLHRSNFPHLLNLTFCSNRIQELAKFEYLNFPELNQLDIERSNDRNGFEDFRPLVKMRIVHSNVCFCINFTIVGALKSNKLKKKNKEVFSMFKQSHLPN